MLKKCYWLKITADKSPAENISDLSENFFLGQKHNGCSNFV